MPRGVTSEEDPLGRPNMNWIKDNQFSNDGLYLYNPSISLEIFVFYEHGRWCSQIFLGDKYYQKFCKSKEMCQNWAENKVFSLATKEINKLDRVRDKIDNMKMIRLAKIAKKKLLTELQ